MSQSIIYLDHAAATPIDERVLEAMQPYFSEHFFNPSSPYRPALEVRRAYEAAKETIAHVIGAKADEIIMTAGATESINLAFAGRASVVTTEIEHHAVLASAKKTSHVLVEVDGFGRVSPEAISKALTPEIDLVSVQLANNELGTIQPLSDIAAVVAGERQRRLEAGEKNPLYLHADASQGVGQVDVNVARLAVDLLTLNAGKVYGPKQVGLLWAARQVRLKPLIVGGGQEQAWRSGTENVAGVIGFARALELAAAGRKNEVTRLGLLRDGLEQALLNAFPDAIASGHRKHRLSGHLHISFPGIDAERLIFQLENVGVLAATGSACAANKGTRSHVLTAIGLDPEVADGSLRLTLGHLSNEENIKQAAGYIIAAVKTEKERLTA